jgi:hypothetical protein
VAAGEVPNERVGVVVQVDQRLAHAPRRQHVERAVDEGLSPERHHRFGQVEGERLHAGAQAGGQQDGFAGRLHVAS